jgi:hypothetical protein
MDYPLLHFETSNMPSVLTEMVATRPSHPSAADGGNLVDMARSLQQLIDVGPRPGGRHRQPGLRVRQWVRFAKSIARRNYLRHFILRR